jgi:hypothetical protein
MKRMITIALFSALFISTQGCEKKGKTTTVQPDYGCRARTGTGVPLTNYEIGVGGVEYYASDASTKSGAVREARAEYMGNNPDAKESKIRVNCWSCGTKGLDKYGREACEPKIVRVGGSKGCSVSSVGR